LASLSNASTNRTVSLVVVLFKEARVSNVTVEISGIFANVNTDYDNEKAYYIDFYIKSLAFLGQCHINYDCFFCSSSSIHGRKGKVNA
jgi:hypothetical protein